MYFFFSTTNIKKKKRVAWKALVCWLLVDLSLEHYHDVNEPGLVYWRIQEHISTDSYPAPRQLTSRQPTQQPITNTCLSHGKHQLSLTQICRTTQRKTAQFVSLHIFELNKWLLFGEKNKIKQKSLKILPCRGNQGEFI